MTEIIAHRGACFAAPENSLEAFERAIEEGADRIELDVRLSRDAVAVVCHDATTGRIGDRDLPVEARPGSDLVRVRLANGQALPTLDEACAAIAGRVPLDVEIKTESAAAARAVLAVLERHGMQSEAIITCFDGSVLSECRRLGFDGPTGLLVGSRSMSPQQRLYEAWPVGEMARVGATHLVIHYRLAHRLLRAFLERRRLGLWLWTSLEDEAVSEPERAALYRRLTGLGSGGLIVGRIREARQVLGPDRRAVGPTE